MVGKSGVNSAANGEDAIQINANSGTVTLSGDADQPPKEEGGIPAGLTRFQPVVPALPMTQITTAGKGEEMLNILVNDSSFSTNQDKKKKKKGKKGKGKQHKVAKEMGFTAEEILQMKDEAKRAQSKPKIRPVVYFKDFERRFDDLLTKNKTPRAPGFDSISTTGSRRATEKPRVRQKLGGPGYDDVIPQDKPVKKPAKQGEQRERPPTPVFFENYPPPEKEKKKKKVGGLKKRTQSTQEENVNLLLSILHCRDKDKAKKLKKAPAKTGAAGKRSVSGSTKKVGGLKMRKKMSSMSKSRMTMSQASSRRSSAHTPEPKFDQTLSSVHSSTDRTPAKQTIGAESDASASIVASPEAIKSHDSPGMGSIIEKESTNMSARSKKSKSPAKHSLSPGSSLKNRLNALMQSPNISINETNVRQYQCHAGPPGACPHAHTYRTGAANRHVCKDCGDEHVKSPEFKASKPIQPKPFSIKDLSIYSTRLKYRDLKKFDDMVPILLQEGRRKPPSKKTKGIQAGEDEFSDDEAYQAMGKLDREYAMVIHDWQKTPVYHILMRSMPLDKAIIRYCNKTSLNRLAADLRERKEFEERAEIRAKREYQRNRVRNPFLIEDSDSSGPEDTTQARIDEMIALRKMTREERIAEVVKTTLSETEVEYLVGTLRRNKTKRTIDDLSKMYVDAKHTFHVLMMQLGQMQTYEHIMEIYGEKVDEDNLKETTMKLLIRCMYGYDSIERLRIIFKMQKRHAKLWEMLKVDETLDEVKRNKASLNQFKNKNRSKLIKKDEKTDKEGKVAYFCLHASRLFIQVATFMQDSLHVAKPSNASSRKLCVASQFPEEPPREPYLFMGQDLFAKVREDVKQVREAFQDYFKTQIPLIDIDGKLVKPPKPKEPGKK